MKKRVFIASSGDLAKEREQVETLLYRKGFQPVLWEALEKSITQEKFQERLNRTELIRSNIVIFMVQTKFGKYTRQEFDFSYDNLGEEIERIYVYFFATDMHKVSDEESENIRSFKKELAEKEEVIYNHIENITELEREILSEKDYWELPKSSNSTASNPNSELTLQKAVEKFLTKQNEIHLLQQTLLKYHPSKSKQPELTVEEILDGLVQYGKAPNSDCVPLLCVLNDLFDRYNHELCLKEYIEFLKTKKYKHIESCECQENPSAFDIHIGIEFFDDSDENSGLYSVVLWELKSNVYKKSRLSYKNIIDIKNKNTLTKLLSELHIYLTQSGYTHIFIEIILPLDIYEKIVLATDKASNYKGIKDWSIQEKRRNQIKEAEFISTYKYIYRIQDRFRKPKQPRWQENWKNIDETKTILFNTDNIGRLNCFSYDGCLSSANRCVISYKQIENLFDLLDDIEYHCIPMALVALSNSIDKDKFEALTHLSMESSKHEITEFVRLNHHNTNSDILFLLDSHEDRPIGEPYSS